MFKRGAGALVGLIIGVVLALCWWAPVFAHAIVVRTEPPDGASLATPPKQLKLWFTEPIALNLTTIDLVDSHDQHITIVGVHADAASQALALRAPGAVAMPVLVVVDLPSLPAGAYRLSWKTVSSSDVHTTSGSLVFGVQRAASLPPVATVAPVPSAGEVLLRWLNLVAFGALVGVLALIAMQQSSGEPAETGAAIARLHHRLLRLAAVAAVTALAGGFGLLLVQITASTPALGALGPSAWQILSATSYGAVWLVRQMILLLLLGGILLSNTFASPDQSLTRGFQRWARRCVAGGLVLALATAQALSGHVASDASPLPLAADTLHLLAASLWIGGVFTLAVAIVPLLRAGPAAKTVAWAALYRFGALAAAALAILLITGLYLSGRQVASIDALVSTLYGQALLAKLAVLMIVGVIGLLNAGSLHPTVAGFLTRVSRRMPVNPRRLGLRVRAEAVGGLCILLLAGLLGSAQPARGLEFDPPAPEAPPASATGRANDLIVTLAVRPNRPGQNFVALGVFNSRRPAPAPIEKVMLRLQQPGHGSSDIIRTATALGDSRYQIAGDAIDREGDWQLTVTVYRAGLPDASVTLPWTVLPPAPTIAPKSPLISNQPLEPWTTGAALSALTMAVIVMILLIVRRFRSIATQRTSQLAGRRRSPPAPSTERPMHDSP